MSAERGDVVVAADLFKDDDTAGRPFLVIDRPEMPFHGEQYIALALTTRTWHDDWVDGGAPESSSIMPWSVNSLKREWITAEQGTLHQTVVDQAVDQLRRYVE